MLSRSVPFHWGSAAVGSGVPSGGALVAGAVGLSPGSVLPCADPGASVAASQLLVPLGSKTQSNVDWNFDP